MYLLMCSCMHTHVSTYTHTPYTHILSLKNIFKGIANLINTYFLRSLPHCFWDRVWCSQGWLWILCVAKPILLSLLYKGWNYRHSPLHRTRSIFLGSCHILSTTWKEPLHCCPLLLVTNARVLSEVGKAACGLWRHGSVGAVLPRKPENRVWIPGTHIECWVQ